MLSIKNLINRPIILDLVLLVFVASIPNCSQSSRGTDSDLYLAGYQLQGKVITYGGGHELNLMLLKEIFKDNSNYELSHGYFNHKASKVIVN